MKNKPTILVVDDDHAHRMMLQTLLDGWGHGVCEADDGQTAIDKVRERPFDLILMDIRMAHVSGIEALTEIKRFNPAIPIIIMTAYSSVETAIDALKKGAYDYLTKPLDFTKLKVTIDKALEHMHLKEENRRLKASLSKHFDRCRIIGHSASMLKLLETVDQVAPSEATVLIEGASGTGKELIAGAIHYNSLRKEGPFIKLNCAALTETLLESELFGHERGAFTGAERQKEGRFVQAHRGSLFLDEVSEMSLTMQVKLLRVLQEREITRVGGEKVIPIDVRVIGATNKNLQALVHEGLFREDLFYRLNVVSLQIPTLKERIDDVPLLARHFLDDFAEKNSKIIKGFTPKAMDCLIRYNWPGNVRELMNVVERVVVLAREEYIDMKDLPILSPHERENLQAGDVLEEASEKSSRFSLKNIEKETIIKTLEQTGGNKSKAARNLGITRKTLHNKLKKYDIME